MSEKSVAEKLQVKGIRSLALVGAPPGLDEAVGAYTARIAIAEADVILLASCNRASLDRELPAVLAMAKPAAILWVAYLKLRSPLASDLSRDVIRMLAPLHGLDTVSQIAIDDDWSALRLKRS